MTEAEFNAAARAAHMAMVRSGFQGYYTDRNGETRATTDLIAPGIYAYWQRTLPGGAESGLPIVVEPIPPRVMPRQIAPGSSMVMGTVPVTTPQLSGTTGPVPAVIGEMPAFTRVIGGPVSPASPVNVGPPPQRELEPPFNFDAVGPVTRQPRVTTRGVDHTAAIAAEGGARMSARSELLRTAQRGEGARPAFLGLPDFGSPGAGFTAGFDWNQFLGGLANAAFQRISRGGSQPQLPAPPGTFGGGRMPAIPGVDAGCGCPKKRRRRGITAAQLTGFNRVVSLLHRVGMTPRKLHTRPKGKK